MPRDGLSLRALITHGLVDHFRNQADKSRHRVFAGHDLLSHIRVGHHHLEDRIRHNILYFAVGKLIQGVVVLSKITLQQSSLKNRR